MKLRQEKPPFLRPAGVLGVRRLARGRARGAPSAWPDRPHRARAPPDGYGASGPDARAAGAAAPQGGGRAGARKRNQRSSNTTNSINRCLQFADHSGQAPGTRRPVAVPRGRGPPPHRGGRAAEWTSVRGEKLDKNEREPAGAGFAFSKPWEDASLCLFFIALMDFCGWVF